MFLRGWWIWWVLLTLSPSTCGLEISGYESDEVICSQGLSDCTMKDEIILLAENDGVDVQNLTANFNLCSDTKETCALCLVIDTEFHIHLDKNMEDEGPSGNNEEDDSEEARKPKASLTVCYQTASTMPTCKKAEFSVNQTAVTQHNRAKVSMVITKPAGLSFSSKVIVYPSSLLHLTQRVVVPSLEKVCSLELKKCVEECQVPELSIVIPKEKNHVELQFDGKNNSSLSVCIQHEHNGICQSWERKTIPLYSVTHCMCLKTWYDQNFVRSRRCPFANMDFSQRNVWQNVSVSVGQGQTNQHCELLLWNLSAPCRLEGEVWPCRKEGSSCREIRGLRQQLANKKWRQNRKGLWEETGYFEDVDLQLSPCVMVKVKGMGHELGPFCFKNTDRWRWGLLVVFVMLLFCFAMLVFFILHSFVKKWVWSWHHGGFVKIGREGRVLLLSPPDVDDGVSESVCGLGSLLCKQGFNVSVDQWSRKEQCALGPLPWLHSQLLKLNTQGDRVVVVLNKKAQERTEEWVHKHKRVITKKMADEGLPQIWSPYSDVFTASLCLIQADKQQGRNGERFLLVKFDSSPSSDRNLPELLQGLPLFQLPPQTQALLTELRLGRTGRTSGGKIWTGWKWGGSDGWSAKTKEGSDQHKTSLCKYIGVDTNLETIPLKFP
ncbi:interleukin-17 receptor C [Pleuronectes platessa]|uniref:interleukin-17 receptor C n=1 Tax=Pleuronectes platessa TaxID=8262 RepID=UPI00232A2E06|nr:interleukin-17 receptor C [Pleuronectes platessa]